MFASRAAVALALLASLPGVARAQWTRVADVPATEVGAVYASGGTLYAGALDAVYVSRDGGTTWTRSAPLPGDLDGVWALAVHAGRLFAGSYGGVLESTNDGATWVRRDAGLTNPGARQITAFAVHEGFLYAGTSGEGVYRLNLAASSPVWQPFSNGLPGNIDAVFGTGGLLVAGGSANGYVFRCEMGGACWTEHRFVAFDANGPRMWALTETGSVLLGGSSHGLFRSTDRGRTWTRFNPGVGLLDDVSFGTDGPRVYALASRAAGGTYVSISDDGGLTWPLLERLPGAFTYSASVHAGRLFAGRFDGLWVRPLASTPADALPATSGVRLLPAAPEPFVTTTRLTYELDAPGEVELAVFDVTGRHVATLDHGVRTPGRHEVVWTPEHLPAGVYVVRLTAGGHRVTRLIHHVNL